MRNSTFILLALILLGCSPVRHLKKAEAFITMVPPIDVVSHNPNPDPSAMDPMRYYDFFLNAVAKALNEQGIKTIVDLPGMERTEMKPNQFAIEIGMAHIEDMRMEAGLLDAIPDENPDLDKIKFMLVGGFNSVDKKNLAIAKTTSIEVELGNEGVAALIKEDPNADPIKHIIDQGATAFSESLKPLIIEHLKANKKGF